MRSFIGTVPMSVLLLVLAVIIIVFLSPATARRLGVSRPVAALLMFGFGLVIAATLSPDVDALAGIGSDGTCDLSRIGFAPIADLTRVSMASLNVLLFVPLGIAVGLLPRTRAAAIVTFAAISLTFVVEGVQLVVTALGRGCQSADLFDNLMGLGIGIGIGLLARLVLRALRD
ncbi:MAG: VanZ family protein [Chloroflexota bacterium]|nr:VanZ family protein [Chloroflexota bacterium]